MDNRTVFHFSDNYNTNFAGIKKLFDFYREASEYYNETLFLDFYQLTFFDGNLSALFGSILSKLTTENNLEFSTDQKFLQEHFHVLYRNGFLKTDTKMEDQQQTTVSFRSFDPDDNKGFNSYIENELFSHRGMPPLSEKEKEEIMDSLFEVFCNIQEHSRSKEPFYACGQYYPKQGILAFSMVDLGVGFLPAIEAKTEGRINNSYDAIKWALEKKHTTSKRPGGLGLFKLNSYFHRTKGNFQIVTGNTFWSTELENGIIKKFIFPNPYIGSMLNLFFKHN